MHVVVVGCGRVGSRLASTLLAGGHSVAVIDKNPKAFARLPEDFAGSKVVGFGFDRDRLAEADIERADALAAVTSGDNSNIVVARIARETYAVERVVARIYDTRRAEVYERLGIPTVATVAWATDQALRRLTPEHSRTELVDPTGAVTVVERAVPAAWAGHPLHELEVPEQVRVVALTRAGRAVIPGARVVAQDGDVLLLAVATEELGQLEHRLAGGAAAGAH